MGIKDLIEEAAGAFAADKALEAADPDAGFLAKSAAAVAGFEGVSKLKEHFAAGDDAASEDQPTGEQSDDDQPADDDQSQS